MFSLHGRSKNFFKKKVAFYLLCNAQDCIISLCKDVAIDMLRGSGPNAKLKKAEILEAARRKLGREVASNEYTKVILSFFMRWLWYTI